MTVTIELKPELERRAKAEAEALGLPFEDYLEAVIESQLAGGKPTTETSTPAERGRAWEQWAQVTAPTPPSSSGTTARPSTGMTLGSGLPGRHQHPAAQRLARPNSFIAARSGLCCSRALRPRRTPLASQACFVYYAPHSGGW